MPLGAIRPAGWLQRQLRIQADGLTGHLDEFWPDVAESQWFGGKAEGWERAPYWLDGAIPLAWLLDDAPLKARITRYVDFIVAHQRADGWYGPYPVDAVAKRYDMWAILLANKVLAQYHEATGDARVLDAIVKSLRRTGGRPRPHAALRVGQVPLVRGPRCRSSTSTSGRGSRGCSISPGSSARRAWTSRRSSPPTTSVARRRAAASGSGPSTS